MKNAVATFLLIASCVSALTNEKNANGDELQPCSTSGMALTGGSREGYCVDTYGNYGSHICMNIDNSNDDINNFCNLENTAGKLPACVENAQFPCQEDTRLMCPVQNYCVHQCYFSHYLEEIGSCDDIQDIQCDAVNMRSLIAYGKRASVEKYGNALDCIAKKCDISDEMVATLKKTKCGSTASSLVEMALGKGNNDDITEEVNKQIFFWCLAGAGLALFGFALVQNTIRKRATMVNKSKMVEEMEKEAAEKGKDNDTESVADTVTASVSIADGH